MVGHLEAVSEIGKAVRLQMLTGDGKALTEHDEPTQDRLLTEFAKQVLDAVESPIVVGESKGPLDTPTPTHDLHRLPQSQEAASSTPKGMPSTKRQIRAR